MSRRYLLFLLAFNGACALAHERAPSPADGRLSAGWFHACHVTASHALYCWGTNDSGQLGIGTSDEALDAPPFHLDPARVDSEHEYRSVSAGVGTTCAIRVDGSLACWGHNRSGLLGTGDRLPRSLPVVVGNRRDWRAVEVGSGFACGVHDDATMDCWGEPDDGWAWIDDLPPTDASRPTPVPGRYVAMSSSWYRTFVVADDGVISHCENDGAFTSDVSLPMASAIGVGILASFVVGGRGEGWSVDDGGLVTPIALDEPIVRADASYDACALTESGRVVCSERGGYTTWTGIAPREVASHAIALAVGASFVCTLDVDETVWCWSSSPRSPYATTPTALRFE